MTVHADTACKIFDSCKRVPNVATVSAMGNAPAFLNFQGHNALNQAHQYISMNFSNNLSNSLAFTDSWGDFPYNDLQACNYQTNEQQIHNFTVKILIYSFLIIALAILVKKLVTLTKKDLNTLPQVYLKALTSS